MAQEVGSVAQAEPSGAEGFWPKGWWAVVDYKIGIVPLPVFVILIGVIGGFAATGTVPSSRKRPARSRAFSAGKPSLGRSRKDTAVAVRPLPKSFRLSRRVTLMGSVRMSSHHKLTESEDYVYACWFWVVVPSNGTTTWFCLSLDSLAH